MNLIKYPSTNNFRHSVDDVLKKPGYYSDSSNIVFARTVKIHGTNASIVYNIRTKDIVAQSRNRILTLKSDNAGFAAWVDTNKLQILDTIQNFLTTYASTHEELIADGWDNLVIYGEWFGPGIQKNVAVNNLDTKKFAVFATALAHDYEDAADAGSSKILEFINVSNQSAFIKPEIEMYPISIFGYDEVVVNFSNVDTLIKAQDEFAEDAESIGKQCPVASYFGIDGPGEGHVYIPLGNIDTGIKFKVKSKAHTVAKTKVLNVKDIKRLTRVSEFIDTVCTPARLEQGIEYLKEMNIPLDASSTGEYIRWVVLDTLKEEGDVIEQSDFNEKEIKNSLGKMSRTYFLNEVNTIKL